MYVVDFSFDDELLSDYGCIIGGINTKNGSDNIGLGTELSLETIKIKNIDNIIVSKYNDVLTWETSIMKNPCNVGQTQEALYFTDKEIYLLSQWLNKTQYKEFKPIYNDGSFSDLHYYGWFYVEAVYLGGNVIGFDLKFTANSPYAFCNEREILFTLSDASGQDISFFNQFPELDEGYFKPDKMTIKCYSTGMLHFGMRYNGKGKQSVWSGDTQIRNCKIDEVIVLDYKIKTIYSNRRNPIQGTDFNYCFPEIPVKRNIPTEIKLLDNGLGYVSQADFTITYTPYRKVGII